MKNTTVEDLFKAMDKAIMFSKSISNMTDKEQKTFNDKLQELGLIKRYRRINIMNTTDKNNEILGMKIPKITYKNKTIDRITFKTYEYTVVLDIDKITEYIKGALYKHGVHSLDAIRFIWTDTYNDSCYLCICACGVKAAMKVSDGIQAEQFMKDLDNFAELISGKIFNIDDMGEFDNINVKAFDWEISEGYSK